ncbi:MAG: sensor domain-containing diguanylate cyclase [Janthinobacterium lividum]
MDGKLHDEFGRLAALRRYDVLDTPREAPFERLTNLVRTVLDVPISTLTLIDQDRQFYKSCAGMDGSDTPREHSFCTHTIQAREPLFIPDTLLDERFSQYPSVTGEPYIRCYLGVPLKNPEGYNLGSLCALDVRPRDFDAGKIEVLKSFAALAVDELELRRIAQTDSLTGAATRRSFLLAMEKAIARLLRHGQPTALLTIDIDHFKRINDTYGHPAGDQVLVSVSQQLQGLLRREDLLGRLGGEEFGILLSDTDTEQASSMAERLRSSLDADRTPPESLRVTASFGLATLTSPYTTPEMWLSEADQALYAAKRSGRNRCCVAQGQGLLKTV